MRPVIVAGARPNFVKIAPLMRAFADERIHVELVHTGQHYDHAMSGSFFDDLGIRHPDANLEVGGGSHAVQTAEVMSRFDRWLDEHDADVLVVCGDVNSSVACALAAVKRNIPVAHVEAGLRSFDRSMPEEINRVVVDGLSSWLLTPSLDANQNLEHEGTHPDRVRFVGNIMVDSLFAALRSGTPDPLPALGLEAKKYVLVTLHRPAMVDDPEHLVPVLAALGELGREIPILFPVHPRTATRIEELGIQVPATVNLVGPRRYLDFVQLEANALLVLTDSGGVQEETTCLGVRCLTLRSSTERPVTVTEGTNTVIGTDPGVIVPCSLDAMSSAPSSRRPALWDGRTAARIVQELRRPPDPIAWEDHRSW